MALVLTVVSPFSGYARGDQITQAALVNQILSSDWASNVVKSEVDDEVVSGATAVVPAPKAE